MAKVLIAYFSHAGQNYTHGDDAGKSDKALEKWVKKLGIS